MLNATAKMKLGDILDPEVWKTSQKRRAFEKLLAKLEKTHERLEQAMLAAPCDAEHKRLEIRLKTNRKHREKTMMLIAELDRAGPAIGRQSTSNGGLFSNNPH